MEISYKKDGNKNYMIIRNLNIIENDFRLQMIINNNIDGILPMNVRSVNNEKEIYYETTSLISMENMYVQNKMTVAQLSMLIRDINTMTENMKEYLLDISNIAFGMELIYINKKTGKHEFCYVPGENVDFHEELRKLFEKILEYIDYKDRNAVITAYQIQQITVTNDFTIRELVDCINCNIEGQKKLQAEIIRKTNTHYNMAENGNETVWEQDENREVAKENPFGKNKEFTKKNGIKKSEIKKRGSSENERQYRKSIRVNAGLKNLFSLWAKKKERYKGEKDLNFIQGEDVYKEIENASKEQFLLTGYCEGRAIKIEPLYFPYIIGKSKKNSDFAIENQVISRKHLRLVKEITAGENIYFAEDLNSKNGTFINGEPIEAYERIKIKQGDRITLADMDLFVE